MTSPPKYALTTKFNTLARSLDCQVSIAQCNSPNYKPFKAIWDTGATVTVISHKVINELGLNKIDEVNNNTANGIRVAGVYLVEIILPNKVNFSSLRVIDGDITGCDVLIGMDIITQGDFVITNMHKRTILSFQIPSTHKTDYVDEIRIENGKRGFRQPSKKKNRSHKKR